MSQDHRPVSLCDYPSSDDEEEETPRKRKADTSSCIANALQDNSFPKDSRGNLDLLNPDFHWVGNLSKKLASYVPRSVSSSPGDTEFEIESSTWELKVVAKRRKRSSGPSSSSSSSSPSFSSNDNIITPQSSDSALQPCRRKFMFKPFKRNESGKLIHDKSRPEVSVLIPEELAASYGLYVWPSSPVLSWFIWLHQEDFLGKKILELGSGTSLPGLLCAKIGASSVTLTDKGSDSDVLKNVRRAAEINELTDIVTVEELSWGIFYQNLFRYKNSLDYIIGSDLFFDPKVFRDLIITVAWLLRANPSSTFICAVQERSADWSIEEYLLEFGLRASYVYPKEFLKGTGIDEVDLIGGHTIYIMKIYFSS